jgi:predicted nucleotidyltransferase
MAVRFPDRKARTARLRAALPEILARIVDEATERVILFGSTVRGAGGSTSDLDLLVVRHDQRPPTERMEDLYRRARSPIALDLLVYTPRELEIARETSSFVRRALQDSEVVYERGQAVARAGTSRS